MATRTSPIRLTEAGSEDPCSRYSIGGTTISAMKPIEANHMLSLCVGRFSAVGQPVMRRSSSAGSLFIRYAVMSPDALVKTARYAHPCQYDVVPAAPKMRSPITAASATTATQALALRLTLYGVIG